MLKLSLEDTPQSKISAAFNKIQDAISSIQTNEEYLRYLKFAWHFHGYSFSNIMLIYFQMPTAQYVAGYNAWISMNRCVKKGTKAIQILAPLKKKIEPKEILDMTKDDHDALKPEFAIVGFKLVNVFDLSQTEGDDSNLPVLVRGLSEQNINDESLYRKLLDLFSDVCIIEVERMSAKGSFNKETLQIKIKSGLTATQKVKTLIHEYSHYLHHRSYFDDEAYSLGEIIAESSAFICSDYLGLDTSDYSIPYVQSWSGGDLVKVKSVGTKVQKIAEEIIRKIESVK